MLSNEAIEVLNQTQFKEFIALLPDRQLDRPLYEEVNEVLVRCGGKWNRSKKGHVFPYDPKPLVEAVAKTGQMPPKNPTAFFPTPRKLVEWMVEFTHLDCYWTGSRILEPSGGTGGILDVIRETAQANDVEWQIDTCEFLDINRAMLLKKGYNVVASDFMEYQPDFKYQVILMNPPFSLDGAPLAYIDHVMHAWSMLEKAGQFAAIVPPGFMYRSDKKSQDFLRFVCDHLQWEECGEGAFKESGTNTNTLIIYGEKQDVGWRRAPYNGWVSWAAWSASLHFENEYSFYTGLKKVQSFEQFENLCDSTQKNLLKRGEPIWLTKQDIQALWRYFLADEEMHEIAAQIQPASTVKKPEPQMSESDLGGLFAA